MAPSKYNVKSVRRLKDRSSEVQRIQFCTDSTFHLQITWNVENNPPIFGRSRRNKSVSSTITWQAVVCDEGSPWIPFLSVIPSMYQTDQLSQFGMAWPTMAEFVSSKRETFPVALCRQWSVWNQDSQTVGSHWQICNVEVYFVNNPAWLFPSRLFFFCNDR